jgi:neutral ceramidase
MAAGWDIAADSPLLPFVDGRARRARFAVGDPVAAGPPPPLPGGTGLLAGATEVDITPPPGMPKAGYSRNAKTGTGFRSRLRARVLHLRSPSGSLALVQCDLLGGSAVVQRLVARAVTECTDVPAAGVYIGATHTHAGPGQFLGSDFYNRFASNKSGFDPAWTQFLAERIACGVLAAVEHRRPARLAVGQTDVWGLTRNRSLAAHVRNAEATDRRTDRQRAYVSIDPRLHLVRVDAAAPAGGFEPLAATVVFAVHGTGVPMQADHYNADLWGYLVGELAARIEHRHGLRPVVGAVEGPHADVAPALHPGTAGHLEARRVGAGIGAAAAELYERLERSLTDRIELACGLRELDLERNRTSGDVTLPRRAAVGGAVVGGAFENETPVVHRIPPFKPGLPRRRPHGPQGVKRVIGGSLQGLVVPPRSFPQVLPLQVLRIGDVALVGLPFELTVESGRRVGDAVLRAIGADGVADVERAIVTSVANEYAGYCTTPEEYGLQRYEGGHTLYGPATQPFFTAEVARLAAETVRAGVVTDLVPGRRFDLRVRRYLPAPGGPAGRPAGGVAGAGGATCAGPTGAGPGAVRSLPRAATFVDATATTDPRWELEWLDVAPGDLDWHEPLVRVEMADGAGVWRPAVAHGRPVDDQGCDIEVVHVGATREGAHRYATRWWDPGFKAGRRHRFVLVANAGQPEVASEGFD